MKKSGGAASFPAPEYSVSAAPAICIILALSACAFGQLSVVSGSQPNYPLNADSIVLVKVSDRTRHGRDSLAYALPANFLNEMKSNVDSVFQYVDAVRLRRGEITGCSHGPKFTKYIRFFNEKKQVMKISFTCKGFSGGLLDIKADKYPFAITFKPQFTQKLENLAAGMKKK